MCAIGAVLFVLMLLGLWGVAAGDDRYDEITGDERPSEPPQGRMEQ